METLTAWSRALRDPQLRNLPYKVETNEFGQLVLIPHKIQHSRRQGKLILLLREHINLPGDFAVEFAIETEKGVKVPDVVWISESRWSQIPEGAEASTVAPEICIKVLSGSNTETEMEMKRALYFDRGAEEVWTCDESGRIRFFDPSGELEASRLAPSFPSRLE